MANSIEHAKIQALDMIIRHKYDEAVKIYTELISTNENTENKDKSFLFSSRAACYAFGNKLQLGLQDCDHAILLDHHNIDAYTEKYTILMKLKRYKEAQDVLKIAKSLFGEERFLIDCESTIDQSLFTLSYPLMKLITTCAISFIIGLMINQLSSYSGFVQGVAIGIIILLILFINIKKMWQYTNLFCLICKRTLFRYPNRNYNTAIQISQQQSTTSTTSNETRF